MRSVPHGQQAGGSFKHDHERPNEHLILIIGHGPEILPPPRLNELASDAKSVVEYY